jgi:bifunctional DNase/RNase
MHDATVAAIGLTEGEEVPAVLLRVDDRVVPVLVTSDQAHAIQLALDGEGFGRPLTHDLLVDVIAEFGGAVDRVRIDELRDSTFYAKLDAEQYHGGERREAVFDIRASDAVAVALRVDCPIQLSDSVLEEAGRDATAFNLERFER